MSQPLSFRPVVPTASNDGLLRPCRRFAKDPGGIVSTVILAVFAAALGCSSSVTTPPDTTHGTGGSVQAGGGASGTIGPLASSGGMSGSGGADIGMDGGAIGTTGGAFGGEPGSGGSSPNTGGATGVGGEGGAGGGGGTGGGAGGAATPGVRIVGRTAPGPMDGTLIEWSGFWSAVRREN